MTELIHAISNRRGKFYSTVAAVDDDEIVCIGIVGPFKTEQEAESFGDESLIHAKAGRIRDDTTVPNDVRALITKELAAALREHGIESLQHGTRRQLH